MRVRFEGWTAPGFPATARRGAQREWLGPAWGRPWLGLAMVLGLAWCVEAGSRRPYLPVVGPSPLRLGSTTPTETARATLPPLDLGWPTNEVPAEPGWPDADPVLAGSAAGANAPGFTLDLGQDPFRNLAGPAPPPSAAESMAATAPAPAPPPERLIVQPSTTEGEAVSATAILEYLRPGVMGNAVTGVFQGTNAATRIGVIAPVGFQPPAPAVSSSATYTVVPGGAR